MLGNPVDPPVQLDHPVLDGGDLDEERAHRAVDERRVGSPAVRVVVDVLLAPHEGAGFAETLDDALVRLEDLRSGELGDGLVEASPVVDRADDGDARRLAEPLVVLTEAGRHVDDARPLLGGDKIGAEHAEGVRLGREVAEERAVGPPDELGTRHGADELGAGEFGAVLGGPGLTDQVAHAVAFVDRVPDRLARPRARGLRAASTVSSSR